MPYEQLANLHAGTTLSAAITSTSATTFTVTSATGLPTSGNFRVRIDDEIIIVGSISGTTCSNCTRGAEGTTAATHSSGAAVTHMFTAGALLRSIEESTALGTVEGRLTLASNTPITTSDQSSIGTV